MGACQRDVGAEAGKIRGPQRCPHRNTQNLWICTLCSKRDFAGAEELKILRGYSGLKWVHPKSHILRPKEPCGGGVSQSCPTLCDPMDSSPPGSSIHGIFQARVLEWAAISFSTKEPYKEIIKKVGGGPNMLGLAPILRCQEKAHVLSPCHTGTRSDLTWISSLQNCGK